MGYWRQDSEGHSLVLEETGLIWGDSPADTMGDALEQIIVAFRRDLNRPPLAAEVVAGLLFSLETALENDREEYKDA